MKQGLKFTLAAVLTAAAGAALAHDTWFELLAPTPQGQAVLALGTGNRFPLHELPVGFEHLASHGCRGAGAGANAAPSALVYREDRANALVVRSAARVDVGGLTCWAQLLPVEGVVPPDRIEVYLREIQAGPALRAVWAERKARGLSWLERYTKNARIEIGATGAPAPVPVAMAMDVLLASPRWPIRAGEEVVLQVLRHGAPLANLPVELVGPAGLPGLWRTTDAQGRVRVAPPLAGRWLLRGTDLRVAPDNADLWESDFITLAFEAAKAGP